MSGSRYGGYTAQSAQNCTRRVRDATEEQRQAEEFVQRIKADPEGALLAFRSFEDAALRGRVDGEKAKELLQLEQATVNSTHWLYTQHNLQRTDPAKDKDGNPGHKFISCGACKASFADLMTADGDKWRLCPAFVKPTVVAQSEFQ